MVDVSRIFDEYRLIVKKVRPSPQSVSSLAMPRLLLVMVFAIVVTACAAGDTGTSTTTSSTSPPDTSAAITTASVDPPQQDDSPCLAGDRPFANAGVISAFGGITGDATQISGIRWAGHPGCERVVVDLLTADGAPAGALGPVGVDYNETLGIVRVNLPAAVARTAIADSLIDGDLADRAFVVRTEGGSLAIDIHLTAGATVAVRAFEVDAPSRIVIDIKPDAAATPVSGALTSGDVVVIAPPSGRAQSPLVVTGYARVFEAQVVARLYDNREATALIEQRAVAAEWAEMWGEFTITFIDPPQQSLELFVGSDSARNGDLEGVWIAIDMSPAETSTPPEV